MLNSISSLLSQGTNIIWLMIVLPVVFGVILWSLKKSYVPRLIVVVISAAFNLLLAISLYLSEGFYLVIPFASPRLDIAIHVFEYSSLFVTFAAAGFLLVTLYGVVYLKEKVFSGRFLLYMYISLAMMNGAFLSDNLGVMLFFWEGLLCTLFGMLLMNNEGKPKTAIKALVLSGAADLLLMVGIIITVYQAGTPLISEIKALPVTGVSAIGFVCMMLGALGKAGSMPFHSWIPFAANDAPTPFMAAFPGALEKLLGIYLAVRIVSSIYDLKPHSAMSTAIMILGTATLVFAVSMALVQKDMKRLLSYHAISQVGYMVLGIGSGLPIGIIGGMFHMLNNAVYKSCLFMTAGSIEQQTGTTDLRKFGGLGKSMPATMICFVVSGLAISGVPPFNGFFSKELIFDAALETHMVFYVFALLGAFMTAVSFLKMGRAAFFGEFRLPKAITKVRESSFGMILPMGILALLSIVFGVMNSWPIDKLLTHAIFKDIDKHFSGWPHSNLLVIISMVVLLVAVLDHVYGSKKTGRAINAADHIHYAPGLKSIYHAAEKQMFDPYNWLTHIMNAFSAVCTSIEHGVSWIYDVGSVRLLKATGNIFHNISNGNLGRYLLFSLAGVAGLVFIFLVILL